MQLRTAVDFGAAIRERRRQLKLDQAGFARKIGVSRQWVIDVERGHPRAELGLVLRALDALDLRLQAGDEPPRPRRAATVDIDAIVTKATRRTKS